MTEQKTISALILPISTNTWKEDGCRANVTHPLETASPSLRFDRALFHDYTAYLWTCGVKTLILNLGDAIKYESHPEISLPDALSRTEILDEVNRLRDMGFEVIPMLDFSAAHDVWLGEYAYMLSTTPYYRVCADLIDEVIELLSPKYFHVGMGDESYELQKDFQYAATRRNDIWYHDLYCFTSVIRHDGVEVMLFADKMLESPVEGDQKTPYNFVMCHRFDGKLSASRLALYRELTKKYVQLPTFVGDYNEQNLRLWKDYCERTIPEDKLLGLAACVHGAVIEDCRESLYALADMLKAINVQKGE
jgi:hypothetical protein